MSDTQAVVPCRVKKPETYLVSKDGKNSIAGKGRGSHVQSTPQVLRHVRDPELGVSRRREQLGRVLVAALKSWGLAVPGQ